jgi:hypothetical protein
MELGFVVVVAAAVAVEHMLDIVCYCFRKINLKKILAQFKTY